MERKWFSPGGEKVHVRFIGDGSNPDAYLCTFGMKKSTIGLSHERRDGCPFCWMEDEAKLQMIEAGQWADDGGAPARLSAADFPELNPRFVHWAISRGEHPYDTVSATERGIDEEIRRIDGVPWTVAFTQWIRAMWTEWAIGLGYRREGMYHPHEVALASGRRHEVFDEWLSRKVGA